VLLTALVPILFMVVGALIYALSSNPKIAELGGACCSGRAPLPRPSSSQVNPSI
jgi:hypothetical protein